MSRKRRNVKKKWSKRIKKRKRRKKILRLSAFIIIIFIVVVIAWYLTSRPTPTGTLVIHVIDEHTNSTIEGATVTITGPTDATGQSNEQGKYSFDFVPLGTYTVYATKEGYHVHPETAIVKAENTTHHTIKLHKYH